MKTVTDKLKEKQAERERAHEESQELWSTFEEKRTAYTNADGDDSELFEQAHEADSAYGEAADRVNALDGELATLYKLAGRDAPSNGDRPPGLPAQGGQPQPVTPASFADRIIEGEAYQALRERGAFTSSGRLGEHHLGELMSREETFQSLAGHGRQASVIVTDETGDDTVRSFIEPTHRGLVEPRFRPLLIRDLITVGTTDSDSVDYVVETGYVNNAAAVPEASTDAAIGSGSPAVDAEAAGLKPQSRLSYEKKDAVVKTIAHWVAATKKSLADVARLRTVVEARLRRGLDDVLEDQIIDGDAVGENLLGILRTPGVQHQSSDTGPLVENILRAITKVRLAFFEPTAVALNPLDFQDIRLLRDDSGASAGTGGYLFGPPSQAGATTIWGVMSVTGAQFPQGQPLTGDFRVAEFLIREGIQVLASDSHADFFVRNLVAILAEMRGALVVPQPEAFCEVSAGS